MSYFCKMESNRQKKIASILQSDLVDVLQSAARNAQLGVIISVTKVNVSVDLSIAKVYLSVFPTDKRNDLIKGIQSNTSVIKHELAQRTRHQLRRMPELKFYIDDSLEYIDGIERSLKGLDNPVNNPSLLAKRKKK